MRVRVKEHPRSTEREPIWIIESMMWFLPFWNHEAVFLSDNSKELAIKCAQNLKNPQTVEIK